MLGFRRCVLGAVCAVAGVLAFAVAPAFALETHALEASFGEDGTSASEFDYPLSVGLDQSDGDVYVGSAAGTVAKFDSAHQPLAFTGVSFAYSPPANQLAVNSTSHDLYVVAGGPGEAATAVSAYQSDGKPADFTAGPGVGTNEIGGSEVCGVAVDSSGDIYVSEFAAGVQVYAESGELLTSILASGACNLAVDSHGVVYLSYPNGPVEKLVPSPSGLPVTALTSYASAGIVDANASTTVAVDPHTDNVYVDEGSQISEYSNTGSLIDTFGAGATNPLSDSVGLAVYATTGQVYASNFRGAPRQVDVFGPAVLVPDVSTGKASEINPKGSATLNGTVNPEGVPITECFFEYGPSESYEQTAACEQTVGSGSSEVAVSAKITGLTPGTTYHFRLVASNKTVSNKAPSSNGSDETFATYPLPAIVPASATATNITATSAELTAQINPGGLEVTECRFEYGTSTSYTTTVPCEPNTFEGTEAVAASRHIKDLEANTTYHWRVVATSAAGTTTSVDHTFVYDTTTETLPDNRAYEMVTPPHKDGALIGNVGEGTQADVAESGSRVIVPSIQCFSDAESCSVDGEHEGTEFLFSRTSAGWTTTALAPPASEFEVNSAWMVSAEAGTELLAMPTPPMSENDFYVREPDGSFVDIGPTTPPTDGALGTSDFNKSVATSNFSHVAFQEEKPSPWPFADNSSATVLQFSGTKNEAPLLVGVTGGPGSASLISLCGTSLGANTTAQNAGMMSADGETVYFTAEVCGSGTGSNASTPVPVNEVFARIAAARTVAISEPSAFSAAAPYPGCTEEPCIKDVNERGNWSSATFAGASTDGSKAFFTSDQRLTDSASAGGNLYEYDADNPPGEDLIDVSAGDTSGQGPRVEGVMAISADGSHAYFVARGVLSSAVNGQGETARNGANNLYVFVRDTEHPHGQVQFVAQLPESDRERQWESNGGKPVANVTPDGRFLVFESHADLTPDATRADGAIQIYRYDAQTGELTRISIGEHGFNDDGNAGVGHARIVEASRGLAHAGPSRSDPTMSNDGAFVFFESPIALTPHALNDLQISVSEHPFEGRTEAIYAENVYEWHEGHVYLISDGKDTAGVFLPGCRFSATCLLGSDATGANVFFFTADSLVAHDTDTQADLYDARICTSEEPCASESPPLASCLGEACHGTPAAQVSSPSGGTVTLNGQGNLVPSSPIVKPTNKPLTRAEKLAKALKGCRRTHKAKRRKRCETAARRTYGARTASKPNRAKSDKEGK
jgi:hypothetical protein